MYISVIFDYETCIFLIDSTITCYWTQCLLENRLISALVRCLGRVISSFALNGFLFHSNYFLFHSKDFLFHSNYFLFRANLLSSSFRKIRVPVVLGGLTTIAP